jgi:hypothetical protein
MAPDAEIPGVKVCPHCAEELPDEATSCSNCHKDPAKVPAWAAAIRPEATPLGSSMHQSEDAWEPNRLPDPLDGSPGPYESLEPRAAQQRPIPWIAWASLVWALFGGGIVIGLVLGIVARRRIKASNGQLGGLALANIAIALNLVTLVFIVVVIAPSFWRALQSW